MIGVFDSGHGGLTVLRALHAACPDRAFLYLGDHAAAPYGSRSTEEIHTLTLAGVQALFAQGATLVILACNTASAVSLRRLQQTWLADHHPDRRVLGVLVPMVEAITGQPWMAGMVPADWSGDAASHATPPRTIGIFATPRTVDSQAYPREIGKRAPAVRVVQQPCPDLARLIEADAPRSDIRTAVRTHVDALMARLGGVPPDAVMLGCTHYPLVADAFAEALPPAVELLCQPSLTARSLEAYLARHPEFEDRSGVPLRFLTTGDAGRVGDLATRFFGRPVRFDRLAAPVRPADAPLPAACP